MTSRSGQDRAARDQAGGSEGRGQAARAGTPDMVSIVPPTRPPIPSPTPTRPLAYIRPSASSPCDIM